jgi:hypothetical protein
MSHPVTPGPFPRDANMSDPFDLPRSGVRVRGDGSCFLIMEAGSRWPAWIGPDAVSTLVLQGGREPALQFASRALHAIQQVRSARGTLRTLVLAAGERTGEDVFTARCLVCRAAAASMEHRKPSLLVFSGHEELMPEVRHELLSLAGALMMSISGTRIGIHVKLDSSDDPRIERERIERCESSGVFERATDKTKIQEAV